MITKGKTNAASTHSEASGRWDNRPQHEASISSLLNKKSSDTVANAPHTNTSDVKSAKRAQPEECLPTPVTPASGFPAPFSRNAVTVRNHTPDSDDAAPAVAHLQTTTTETKRAPQKQYVCPECNQTFSRPHNLKSHLTTHSSERPFQCSSCPSYFRRQHDLKRHEKLHTGEKPFVCDICQRSFSRLDALNRHRRAQNGTACSSVHRQQTWNNRTINGPTTTTTTSTQSMVTVSPRGSKDHGNSKDHRGNDSNARDVNTSSPPTPPGPEARPLLPPASMPSTRPIVPQLHIPHPASLPLGDEYYPYPPGMVTTSSNASPHHILPSISRLPTTDVPHDPPLKRRRSQASPSASPTLRSQRTRPISVSPPLHPFHTSTASRHNSSSASERTLPPPAPLRHPHHPSSPSATPSPLSQRTASQLEQEIHNLQQQVSYWKSKCENMDALKMKLHDADVENKLLRTLIMDARRSKSHLDDERASIKSKQGEYD